MDGSLTRSKRHVGGGDRETLEANKKTYHSRKGRVQFNDNLLNTDDRHCDITVYAPTIPVKYKSSLK